MGRAGGRPLGMMWEVPAPATTSTSVLKTSKSSSVLASENPFVLRRILVLLPNLTYFRKMLEKNQDQMGVKMFSSLLPQDLQNFR